MKRRTLIAALAVGAVACTPAPARAVAQPTPSSVGSAQSVYTLGFYGAEKTYRYEVDGYVCFVIPPSDIRAGAALSCVKQ